MKRWMLARVPVVTLTRSACAPAFAASITCAPTSQSGLPAFGTDGSIWSTSAILPFAAANAPGAQPRPASETASAIGPVSASPVGAQRSSTAGSAAVVADVTTRAARAGRSPRGSR